jgi:hypothetical protein
MILTPIAIVAAACTTPNRPASVSHFATLEYDGMADFPRYPLDILVDVNLDARGLPTYVHLVKSSGNRSADHEALLLARQSVYAAKIVNCVPTAGSVVFRAHIPAAPHS